MITLSSLAKTWLIDVDGTIFRHNENFNEEDVLLPGVAALFSTIPIEDMIILLTARGELAREATTSALTKYGIRFNEIIFNIPRGERLLINDIKPSGLLTAYAFNVARDGGLFPVLENLQLYDRL